MDWLARWLLKKRKQKREKQQMYLSNRQVLQLITPLFVTLLLLFFQEDIITAMHAGFPKIETIKESEIYQNVDEYLKISEEMQTYDTILQKISKRKNAIDRTTSMMFGKKQPIQRRKKEPIVRKKRADIKSKKHSWDLKIVFPKDNLAIIDSQFVHKGSIVNGAEVVQIEFDSVLLKTNKGFQWVYLFL